MKLRTFAVLLASASAITAPALADTSTAPGQMKKIGPALENVYKSDGKAAKGKVTAADHIKGANGGYVVIDAVARGRVSDLKADLKEMGARNISAYGKVVSAQVPVRSLGALEQSRYLQFARPALAERNVGLVTQQGDRGMRTDEVRADLGFDGTNIRVGVLSDSFSCTTSAIGTNGWTSTAEDIANDDLPEDVVILSDIASGCIDEGRAMAQLIHDAAPEASIAFWSAFNGMADFANGIVKLATVAGSDVIVDDIIYFAEPMFQDGIIAQAADEVHRLGVPYYSSNGNRARTAHREEYRAISDTLDGIAGPWHDFDAGPGEDLLQTVRLTRGSARFAQTTLSFQWDEPNFSVSGAPGSASDVDVVMFDMAGNAVPDCFDPVTGAFVAPANGLCSFQNADGGVGGDAIELFNLVHWPVSPGTDPTAIDVQIGFRTEAGPAPGLVMYVPFARTGGFAEIQWATNSGSGYGHNNAAGAEGVGASAFVFNEEHIGDPKVLQLAGNACVPACLNDFSSAGGTPIVFDTAGNRLATPEVRFKPGVTAPDGGNTTFFVNDTFRDDDDGDGMFVSFEPGEFGNFFGTSAAAPNAATIAALLYDKENTNIRVIAKNGKEKFRMCVTGGGPRSGGDSVSVSPNAVAGQIRDGSVLGPCNRSEAQTIFDAIRSTADDMSERRNLSSGALIQTFDEVGPDGFDYDSGFGMVDAVEAITNF